MSESSHGLYGNEGGNSYEHCVDLIADEIVDNLLKKLVKEEYEYTNKIVTLGTNICDFNNTSNLKKHELDYSENRSTWPKSSKDIISVADNCEFVSEGSNVSNHWFQSYSADSPKACKQQCFTKDQAIQTVSNDDIDLTFTEDKFLLFARKCGIKIGSSGDYKVEEPKHAGSMSSNLESPKYECKPGLPSKQLRSNIFEELAHRSGIKVSSGSKSSTNKKSCGQTSEQSNVGKSPKVAQSHRMNCREQIAFSFEELARRHGIKISTKRREHVATQTRQKVTNTKSSQTSKPEMVNVDVQVTARKEAFQKEFDVWMGEELSAPELTHRQMYLSEVAARKDAEEKLVSSLDANVREHRDHRQACDEMKEVIRNQEIEIEKLSKELKTLRKHKDNEIKQLSKDLKQREEELFASNEKNNVKDVTIFNMRQMAAERSGDIDHLKKSLQDLQAKLETLDKQNNSVFLKAQKEQKHMSMESEWQTVNGSNKSKTKKDTIFKCKPHAASHLSLFDSEAELAYSGGGCEQPSADAAGLTTAKENPLMKPQAPLLGSDNTLGNSIVHIANISPKKGEVPSDFDGFKATDHTQQSMSVIPAHSDPAQQGVVYPLFPPELLALQYSSVPMFPGIGGYIGQVTPSYPVPPPGITTEPVPLGDETASQPQKPRNDKHSSFDKLMVALKESFPAYSRPELMIYLKQAKASCGSTGFRGKQISEVVAKVAEIINQDSRQC
ncbi:uncharacterized protein LOC116601529 isoform X2 [Nematostella vectensis]|nr:uncharacterized protein LOC116601529 isoform X2 [Nematostella vectensis]